MTDQPRLVYLPGDHTCTRYSSPQEQLCAAMQDIRVGLARGERCLEQKLQQLHPA